MTEARIERRLVKKIREIGGRCLKWTSPGRVGVPDRMVLLPNGKMIFVECKAPGKKPRPIQVKQMDMLNELGFKVKVLDSFDAVDEFVECVKSVSAT